MILKCNHCGKQQNIETALYASPVFCCEKCNKLFYDKKVVEAAIFPPEKVKKEKIEFFIYIGFFMFLGLFVFGLISNEEKLIFGCGFLFFLALLYIGLAHMSYRIRVRKMKKVIEKSKQRLKSKEYQEKLIYASNGSTEILKAIQQFNIKNNYKYTFDVISILNGNSYLNPSIQQDSIKVINKNVAFSFIYCRKCGAKIPSDSLYCQKCGEKVFVI